MISVKADTVPNLDTPQTTLAPGGTKTPFESSGSPAAQQEELARRDVPAQAKVAQILLRIAHQNPDMDTRLAVLEFGLSQARGDSPDAVAWREAFADEIRRLRQVPQRAATLLHQLNPKPAQPATETGVAIWAKSAKLGKPDKRFKLSEEMQNNVASLEHIARLSHGWYLVALQPGESSVDNVGAGLLQMRAALRDNVVRMLDGLQQAAKGVADVPKRFAIAAGQAPWTLDRMPRAQREALEMHERLNTWHPGESASALTAPTSFTNSADLDIATTARTILSPSRLDLIAFASTGEGGAKGIHIRDLDGRLCSYAEVYKGFYGYLFDTDKDGESKLWKTLHSPFAREAIRQSGNSAWLAKQSRFDVDELVMAQRIASVAIHYAVRDSIHYGLGNWRQRASEVLRLRQASCSGSANLATALARAANIPAGCVQSIVIMPHYFGEAMPPSALPVREKLSVHYHVGWVMLTRDGWQRCDSDPSDQEQLAEGIGHLNYPSTRLVDFDGVTPSLLNFEPEYLAFRGGPLKNVDALLDKPATGVLSVAELEDFVTQSFARNSGDIEALARDAANKIVRGKAEEKAATASSAQWLQKYDTAVRGFLDSPKTREVFGYTISALRGVFSDSESLQQLLRGADAAVMWKAYRAALGKAGIDLSRAPRDDMATGVLAEACASIRSALQGLDAGAQAALVAAHAVRKNGPWRLAALPRAQQIGTAAEVFKGYHAFATMCYPTTSENAFGPRHKQRFMPAREQEQYRNFIAAKGLFADPTYAALSYVLGGADPFLPHGDMSDGEILQVLKERAPVLRRDAEKMRQEFFVALDYHSHLHSSVSAEVMNLLLRFGVDKAINLRQPEDVGLEFEKWLAERHPALAKLHQRELLSNPEYMYSVYSYLLQRLPPGLPPKPARLLSEFIREVEKGPPVTSMKALDAILKTFLSFSDAADHFGKQDGHGDYQDFFSVRGDARYDKPFGLLYQLWAVSYLPLEEATALLQRMFRHDHQPRMPPDIDLLG